MRKILVVGDLMIDRNLVIAPGPRHSTSTSHFDIDPEIVMEPTWEPDCVAGAGNLARCLLAGDETLNATLVAGYPDGYLVKATVPEKPLRKRLHTVQAFKTKFVTTKYRMYAYEGTHLKLRQRIDRDLTAVEHTRLNPDWADKVGHGIEAVVVDHFGKGLLEHNKIREKLAAYPGKPFLMRTKRPLKKEIAELPWTYLCIARPDLGRMAEELGVGGHIASLFRIRKEKDKTTTLLVHPDAVALLEKLATGHGWEKKGCHVVIRSSGEGALVLSRGKLTGIALPPESTRHPAAVGAGDVFLANLTIGCLLSKNPVKAAKRALAYESEYSRPGDGVLTRTADWYATRATVEKSKAESVEGSLETSQSVNLKGMAEQTRQRQSICGVLAAGVIDLDEADWCLKKFATVDPGLRADIERLKNGISEYVRKPTKERPFVAAICGSPGSGKSTLACALGEWLHGILTGGMASTRATIESNAAQWTSMEELSCLCETIRSRVILDDVPIVFVDEVDSKVGGEDLYGKLLAPTWDGAYFLRGERRDIGKSVIFLLAGSGEDWKTGKALRDAAERPGTGKLRDLVSRLSTQPVELKSLGERRADVAYLVASKLRKRFPRIESVQAGLLRLFAESTCVHGPRSIDRVLDRIRKPATKIGTKDLESLDADLDLDLRGRPADWRKDGHEVTIQPKP